MKINKTNKNNKIMRKKNEKLPDKFKCVIDSNLFKVCTSGLIDSSEDPFKLIDSISFEFLRKEWRNSLNSSFDKSSSINCGILLLLF